MTDNVLTPGQQAEPFEQLAIEVPREALVRAPEISEVYEVLMALDDFEPSDQEDYRNRLYTPLEIVTP